LILNREQDLLGASFLALRRHVESPTELRADEWSELHGSIREARELLTRAFQPDHFNFAFLGNVERHLHLHVLPRYASARTAIGLTFTDPGYPGHYALVDTARLAPDQLERLADEIGSG
jgi:diadenosine tetraphosphate (Ap4A) HIT family hydrolase